MPQDLARLTVLLDAGKKKAFDALCAELGTNASQVVRELIQHYLSRGDEREAYLPRPTAEDEPAPSSR